MSAVASTVQSCGHMLTADEIFGKGPTATLCSSSVTLIALATAMMPTIEDVMILDLVELLALALVNRDDEVRAIRELLTSALAQSHTLIVERDRRREQQHRLRDEYRALRVQTVRQSEPA